MSGRLRWEAHRTSWPNASFSRFVHAGGVRWHLQQADSPAPGAVVLVHGTGASSHSWHKLLPLLHPRATVIAPDLPGHGFSSPPTEADGMSMHGMAKALATLLHTLDIDAQAPLVLVGHSAGAAVLMRACLDSYLAATVPLISLAGALLPFPGIAGQLLTPMAQGMARLGLVGELFAWHVRTDRQVVRELLRQTGSTIDERSADCYRVLAGNAEHVQSAMDMMAAWELAGLANDLPRLRNPSLLVAAARDGAVPPRQAQEAGERIPRAQVLTLEGLGHLAHEEAPERIVPLIDEALERLILG
ncbi:MAG: alpha/beta fold hydrolase BchO [Pseudomonadota bacterium]